MPDFALLPPEINSGLMYAGPGAGPMLAAAAGWQTLAAELETTAFGYSAVIAGLTGLAWSGPASMAMAAAATPYVGWLSATGAAAVTSSVQAYAAAAAYETAFAMTVPPPVIAANRALLMALIATNFFGQNTPAIAATEAQYLEMWAQDATAMYGYAVAAETASTLESFDEPPQTTKSDGRDAQARKHASDGAHRGRGGHRGGQRGQRGHGRGRGWNHCGGDPQQPSPTTIDPGAANAAGTEGATVAVNEGTVTIGPGSTFTATQDSVTAGANGAVLTYPEFKPIILGPFESVSFPRFIGTNITVSSGSVTVGPGSTVTLGPGGSLTGGIQGATVTVTSGTITPVAPVAPVAPATTATPAAAAPAATTTSTAPATSATTSSSTAGTTSSSGTTSGTTAAPAEQVPGAQSAPAPQPQSAPGAQAQPASVAQVAPGVAAPQAASGVAAPLGIPGAAGGGVVPAVPAAPVGGPMQFVTDVNGPVGAAPDLALGDQAGSLPFVHTDKVVLTSGATLLGAGGGGGLTAFVNTKPTFYRGETVVTKLQHEALVRDASLRFAKRLDAIQAGINSSSTLELSTGLDELVSSNHAVGSLFGQVQAGAVAPTADQALKLLEGAAEPTPPTIDHIATAMFHAAPGAPPQLAELNSLMAELKFIMPRDVLEKAQYAAIATLFAAHVSEADTPTSNWSQASSAAVADFVEAVRSDFGLDPIAPS